jgi:Zn-dependent peptidase ImmA (M78 family)/transcriptional regulator with XRE-family HTH domain
MKEIIAKRIKSARTLAGYSLRQLADKMNGLVSHNAITKYEKGLMMPDSTVLVALANALNVKTDYFFLPYTVSIENIEFRKKSRLPAKSVGAIKEEVTDRLTNYIELEQFLNLSPAFVNPIQDRVIRNGEELEDAVNHLLTVWKLGFNALPNVIELLEEKEVKVIELDADENFDGLSGWANAGIPVVVVNQNFPVERKRFTALHELGHLVLQFDAALNAQQKEKLCHRFAGAMLMPKETFLKVLAPPRNSISLPELVIIKETYGISVQAIMARAKDLNVVDESRYVNFRRWISQGEERKKELDLGSYIGREHSSRFRQLLYRATAEEVISMSKAANLANQKLATFRDEYMVL